MKQLRQTPIDLPTVTHKAKCGILFLRYSSHNFWIAKQHASRIQSDVHRWRSWYIFRIPSRKVRWQAGKPAFLTRDTSSNDCFSIVMLVFGVYVLDFRDFFLPWGPRDYFSVLYCNVMYLIYTIFYNRVYKSIQICLYTGYLICMHIIYIYICKWITNVYISIYIFCSIQEFFHLWRTFKSPASWGGDSQQLSADSAEPRNESNTQLLLPFCRKLPLKASYFWTWIKFCLIQVLVASWFFENMQAMQAACKRLC